MLLLPLLLTIMVPVRHSTSPFSSHSIASKVGVMASPLPPFKESREVSIEPKASKQQTSSSSKLSFVEDATDEAFHVDDDSAGQLSWSLHVRQVELKERKMGTSDTEKASAVNKQEDEPKDEAKVEMSNWHFITEPIIDEGTFATPLQDGKGRWPLQSLKTKRETKGEDNGGDEGDEYGGWHFSRRQCNE